VAPSTVSRVLNGASAAPETRAAILAAVDELGFRPNPIARSLRSRATHAIGFQVSDISNPLFGRAALGVERVLADAGYVVLLSNSGGDRAREEDQLRALAQRTDGLIVSLVQQEDQRVAELVASLGVPVVLLDREMPGGVADRVVSDHRLGTSAAIDYLIDLGHRRIGFLCGPVSLRPGRERLAGYHESLERRGVPVDEALVRSGSLSTSFGARESASLLDLPRPPTALLAASNQLGVGALETIRRRRVRIPEDLSLVIGDELDAARLNMPPITVVARDMELLGRTAAEMLLEVLAQRRTPGTARVELATQLVVRSSCRAIGSQPSGIDSGSTVVFGSRNLT
jgi:LacI family transcriptional regulator